MNRQSREILKPSSTRYVRPGEDLFPRADGQPQPMVRVRDPLGPARGVINAMVAGTSIWCLLALIALAAANYCAGSSAAAPLQREEVWR